LGLKFKVLVDVHASLFLLQRQVEVIRIAFCVTHYTHSYPIHARVQWSHTTVGLAQTQ